MNTAYIALGSNLGDRELAIESALKRLHQSDGVEVIRRSRLIETEPVGPPGQGPFLNAAAELQTTLTPRQLLQACLDIERSLGRDRTHSVRWGPRVIDIDLLMFADLVIDEPGLKIPHPHLHERTFVLLPLVQIAPTALHPTLDVTIESLCRGLSASVSSSEQLE